MEILSSPFKNISPKKQQYGMRTKYHQVDGKCHKKNSIQTIKFGCDNSKRSCWKIKKVPKLRVMIRMGSPSKLWGKLKNAYNSLAGNNRLTAAGGKNIDAEKRIPKARKVHPTYTQQEFQDRLIFEIYKNMVASRELTSEWREI